jgi:pimeloyl-ACP methyl ester carboxylesterase
LLHGAGGGGWEWLKWLRVLLAEGLDARAIDFSSAAVHSQSFDELASRLGSHMVSSESPVLVGASFGGTLAVSLAQPMRARALILVNPLPPAPWAPGAETAKRARGRRDWGLTARAEGTLRSIPELHAVEASLAFRGWRDFDARLLVQARHGLVMPAPACPVLVMISRQDQDLPAKASRSMAVAWGAEIVECEGSHVGPLLGPQAPRLAWLALERIQALAAR